MNEAKEDKLLEGLEEILKRSKTYQKDGSFDQLKLNEIKKLEVALVTVLEFQKFEQAIRPYASFIASKLPELANAMHNARSILASEALRTISISKQRFLALCDYIHRN